MTSIACFINIGLKGCCSVPQLNPPGMCTHTCTCTSAGTLHRVRGLRARPFSITPSCRQPHSVFGGYWSQMVNNLQVKESNFWVVCSNMPSRNSKRSNLGPRSSRMLSDMLWLTFRYCETFDVALRMCVKPHTTHPRRPRRPLERQLVTASTNSDRDLLSDLFSFH